MAVFWLDKNRVTGPNQKLNTLFTWPYFVNFFSRIVRRQEIGRKATKFKYMYLYR